MRSDPDRDDRLAQRHDDHEPVAFGEVLRSDDEAGPRRAEDHGAPDERGRGDPQRPLRVAAEHAAGEQQRGGGEVERGDAEHRRGLAVRRARDEQAAVQDDHDGVADRERRAAAVERRRDRERHDEEPRHAPEQQQPVLPAVRRDRVGEPDVAAVHPPRRHEDEQRHRDAAKVGALGKQPGELRDREDERQVEEQLERGRSPAARRGARFHGETLTAAAACIANETSLCSDLSRGRRRMRQTVGLTPRI
jgi:hypothetical protein